MVVNTLFKQQVGHFSSEWPRAVKAAPRPALLLKGTQAGQSCPLAAAGSTAQLVTRSSVRSVAFSSCSRKTECKTTSNNGHNYNLSGHYGSVFNFTRHQIKRQQGEIRYFSNNLGATLNVIETSYTQRGLQVLLAFLQETHKIKTATVPYVLFVFRLDLHKARITGTYR